MNNYYLIAGLIATLLVSFRITFIFLSKKKKLPPFIEQEDDEAGYW